MKFLNHLVPVSTLALVIFGAPIYDIVHDNWPMAGAEEKYSFQEVRSGAAAKEIEKKLVARSQLDELARPRYNEALYLTLGRTNPGVVSGPNHWLFPENRLRDPGKGNRALLPKTVKAMGEVARFLTSQDCLVINQLIPRKRTLYPEQLPTNLEEPYDPTFELVFDLMVEEGLRVPDLRPVLKPEEGLLFFTNDNHWTQLGCHTVGKFMADYIRDLFPEGVPGEPVDVEFRHYPEKEFIGYQQRLLGFQKGSWVYNKFTNYAVPIHAVRKSNPNHQENGSKEPQPILLVGTSFSRGPFYYASQLIGHLGVQIENHSLDGYAAGYRIVDVFKEILTERRPIPELLVWEMPEDFPIREGRYILEPLESVLSVLPNWPYEVQPVDAKSAALSGIQVKKEEEGILHGLLEGPKSTFTFTLDEPIPGDGGYALCFDFNTPSNGKHSGLLVVEWGTDPNVQPLGTKSVLIRRSSWLHPVLVNLENARPGEIRFIRIRPFDGRTDFDFGNVEIWKPKGA